MSYFELGQRAAEHFDAGDTKAFKLTMLERRESIYEEVEDELASHGSRAADQLENALQLAFSDGWRYYRSQRLQ